MAAAAAAVVAAAAAFGGVSRCFLFQRELVQCQCLSSPLAVVMPVLDIAVAAAESRLHLSPSQLPLLVPETIALPALMLLLLILLPAQAAPAER